MEFRAASVEWMDRVDILVCQRDHTTDKIGSVAEPLQFTMKARDPGMPILQATLELSSQEASNLMNALWQAGVRPSDFKHPSGEVNRLEAHLSDMRKLVFKDA